ncbi:tripartite tricarboxylate transporter TctB family protein [Roseibium suaedae]|uniref:Putative tricarboxylic transport membrane protein n=1 Tax=Roseibium suaedae TaxID=735517 RepID=A0A1M7NT62_9HYPH|nr:tripartite tricarboxylate transporter TctB family protein [Roseibium suaedae]SHN06705.1 putative tricarboxylic transport membrane protein [Roseibium suaedae]
MSTAQHSKADIWIGAGLLGFCAFATWRTLQIKQVVSSTIAGPSFVPWLMIGAVSILSLVLIVRGLRSSGLPGSLSTENLPDRGGLLKLAAFAVLLVAYAAAFYPVGYIPSTLVASFAGLWLIGERKILVLLGFPVIMTTAVYYGFTELLAVWLP